MRHRSHWGKAARFGKCPCIGAAAMLSVLDALDVQQDLRDYRRARMKLLDAVQRDCLKALTRPVDVDVSLDRIRIRVKEMNQG